MLLVLVAFLAHGQDRTTSTADLVFKGSDDWAGLGRSGGGGT
jgi:hypothetical protein